MPEFESLPGRGGRWLVRDRDRRFTVPADLGERLRAPGGERLWRDLAAGRVTGGGRNRGGRGLWLRVTVLPAPLVRLLAHPLRGGTSWPVLALLVLLGMAGLLLSRVVVRDGPGISSVAWPEALAFFLLTALVHELGHAAALRREGWPPGAVGVGVLWVLPVLWCDVSAASLLPRGGRARVDLAGVAFQLAAAGTVAMVSSFAGIAAGLVGAQLAVAAIIWSLLPLARTDGYWLACDLLDLPDLEAEPRGSPRRARRLAIVAWRLFTALLLVALVLALPWRLHRMLGSLLPDHQAFALAARAVIGSVLLVGGVRALTRVGRILVVVRRDWTSRPEEVLEFAKARRDFDVRS